METNAPIQFAYREVYKSYTAKKAWQVSDVDNPMLVLGEVRVSSDSLIMELRTLVVGGASPQCVSPGDEGTTQASDEASTPTSTGPLSSDAGLYLSQISRRLTHAESREVDDVLLQDGTMSSLCPKEVSTD